MNIARRAPLLIGSLGALALALAGCSAGSGDGFSKAGKQGGNKPLAVITPVGNVPDSNGVLRVRSGAEVVLSAKDSDGRDSAILGFEWAPANTAAEAVKLYERGASAVSFRAPLPPDNTPLELRFRVTARTADGDTGSSEMRVLVGRVPDPDDFLLSDIANVADGVNLVLIPTALQNTTLTADLPFQISIQKRIHYNRARNSGTNPSANPAPTDPVYCAADTAGGTNACVKTGPAVILDSAWLASNGIYGPGAAGYSLANLVRAYQNPHFRLRPPVVNADEVNFAVLSGGISSNASGVPASDTRRDNLLFLADIDSARAEYVLTLTPGPGAATLGLTNALLVMATNTSAPSAIDGLLLTTLGAATTIGGPATVVVSDGVLGSVATAGVVDSRSTAQAYYDAIDPPSTQFPEGRRSTVDAWLKDNCLQPDLPGDYGADLDATYLNDRDLGFGREMYFKTSCSTAQQAATGATINTAAGERASIVFNYPSLEAATRRTGAFLAVAMEYRADTSGGIPYTRFYTFAPDPRTKGWKRVLSANFDGRRERYAPGNCTVCHGGKPKADYASGGDLGSTFIPFDPRALLFADTDKSIVDQRFSDEFTYAHQEPKIRALNTQGVLPILQKRKADTAPAGERLARWDAALEVLSGWYPSAGAASNYDYVPQAWRSQVSPNAAGTSSEDIYLKVVAENCRMCHLQRITDAPAGSATLVTSGVPQFRSFAELDGTVTGSAKVKQRVFDEQVMPASRLTTDRFWLPQGTSTQSAAQLLAAHLGLTGDAAVPELRAVATGPAEVEPGTTQSSGVRLSARGSLLAASYAWTLERPAGSAAVLIGANTAEPAFRADVSGTYRAFLTVTDASGKQDQLDAPVVVLGDAKPHAATWQVTVPAASIGTSVFQLFQANGVTLGEGRNTLTATTSIPNASLTYPSYCTDNANDLPGYGGNCKITFTANASGTINYTFTDADGDTSSGVINVTVNVPGGWDTNRAPVASNCTLGSSPLCENANRYVRSCQAPCGGTLSGINPTLLAQQALNLDAGTWNSLGYTAAVTPTTLVTAAFGRSTSGVVGGGSKGSASATSTALSYTAPNFFVTSQGNQTVSDSFQFQIVVRNSGGTIISTSQTGTAYMTVTPRTTWATVVNLLNNPQTNAGNGYACSTCHGPARDPASGRGWGSLSIDTATTYADLAGTGRTSCPVTASGVDAPFVYYCVDFGTPTESLLLKKPHGLYNHGSPSYGTTLQTTPVWNTTDHQTQLNAILNWIRDGAYQN